MIAITNMIGSALADGMPVETVAALLIAVLTAGGGGVLFGRRTKSSTTLEGQPINVRMDDHYVTRREFDKLASDCDRNMTEIKGMMAQVFQRIDERDQRLTAAIKEVAENAYAGRTKIWSTVNSQGERIASVESKCVATHCPTTPPKKLG